MPSLSASPPGAFGATGDFAALIESFDWDSHPLGPPDRWPSTLRGVMRSMQRSRGAMFVCWGPQAHLLYNEQHVQILRDKHPAAFGRPMRAVWPEVGPQLDDMLARALQGEGLYGENVPFTVHRNGRDETAYFSYTWNPLADDDGVVHGFFCSLFETTAAVAAEQARAEEAARVMNLFQQAPGFVAVLDGPGHVFTHANPAYQDFVGRRDFVGQPVHEVAPEAIEQGWGRVLDEVYRTGRPFVGQGASVRLRRDAAGEPEEMTVNFVFQPIRGEAGAVTGILIQGFDVTEQAKAQAALRESEARFRAIADAIPQMVWTTRADGHHEYFNRQWYAYTGVPEGATDGTAWGQVLHPGDLDRTLRVWHHSLATGDPYEIEYRLRHRTGEFRWALGRAVPVRDEAGAILRWMGTCTDIDDQVKARESLQEEDRRKDEFLAMLAHELRNPLAPITSAVALLRRVAGDEARVRSVTDIIGRQAAHMRGLVDDLLDVSRVTRGLITLQRDRVDLREVLAEALEQTRPAIDSRKHAVAMRVGGHGLRVAGDRKRLVQVFANVIGNAAKYTPPGGRIAVEAVERGNDIVVSVTDNGQGMGPELIARVFDLFVQGERTPDRREGGLGIGLALVRRLVELHGGRVTAASEGAGLGSRFEVALPAAEPASESRPTPAHGAAPRATRVLIVDDNRDAGNALAMFLEELGHDVHLETTATRALDAARSFAPDVGLLDAGLPDLDGRELARRLRALPGLDSVVIGLVTADASLAEGGEGEADLQHFLKPLDAEALAKWLWRAVPGQPRVPS